MYKNFYRKNTFINKVLDLGQKSLNAFRNYEQYSIYERNDDDVSFDKINRTLAGIVGKLACIQETKINPILLLISNFFNENINEAFDSIVNFLSSFWWRFRLVFQKISWKQLKLIPGRIKMKILRIKKKHFCPYTIVFHLFGEYSDHFLLESLCQLEHGTN